MKRPATARMSLLLLLAALMALGARRYGWFTVWTLLVAFVRPIALPLALVCAVHGWQRWRRREEEPFEKRDRVKVVVTAVIAALSFGIWPTIAAVRTGELKAYFLTQRAWTDQYTHGWPSWIAQAVTFSTPLAVIGTLVVLGIALALVYQRRASIWGAELRTWTWAYPLYILGSARPTLSIGRYLLLTITPWWPLPSESERERGMRERVILVVDVVVLGVILQYVWLRTSYIIWPGAYGAP